MLLSAALLSLLCTGAILAAEPADFTTRFAQAQEYQKADDDQKALRVLEGPQPPPPLRDPWKFTRAFSLFRLGRLDSAEKGFRDLLSNPDLRAPANFFVANCMFARGRYSDSLFFYEAAIAAGHSPENRVLNAYFYNQGLAFHQLQRLREAAEAFRNSNLAWASAAGLSTGLRSTKYGRRIGMPKFAPHDLRRTFAKLAHKGRAALEQIQLSLGHASIMTTEKYLGTRQDLQDAPCDHLGCDCRPRRSQSKKTRNLWSNRSWPAKHCPVGV
jgi:tetratricopeptide (TPR) repeat protein